MIKYAGPFAVAALIAFWAPPQQQAACLHGPSEAPAQATRRQAAIGFARQVNTLERSGHEQAQSYYMLTDLPGLPALPDGFKAHLSTDGASYAFSVKDTLDPCHFALFSDQDAVIYTAAPIR